MSLESIVSRVINDAKGKADEILKSNTEEVDRIVSRATSEAARVVEEGEKKAGIVAGEEKRKIMSMAALENRKRVLTEKQRVIDRAFQEAVKRLVEGDLNRYRSFLKKQFLGASPDGDEEILFSARDLDRLGKGFVDELNKSLESENKRREITLVDEPAGIIGGLILRKGRKEINCAVEALLGSMRDSIEGEVAGILFPGEDGE